RRGARQRGSDRHGTAHTRAARAGPRARDGKTRPWCCERSPRAGAPVRASDYFRRRRVQAHRYHVSGRQRSRRTAREPRYSRGVHGTTSPSPISLRRVHSALRGGADLMQKKNARARSVETLRHDDKRRNIPTAEHQSVLEKSEAAPRTLRYPRNTDLDPQLVWRGKDEQDWSDLVVQAPPLYIQEKVHPKVLIDDLMRTSGKAKEV